MNWFKRKKKEIIVEIPEELNDTLAELVLSGNVTRTQMQKIISLIRPIIEENAKLKR